MTFFLLLDGF